MGDRGKTVEGWQLPCHDGKESCGPTNSVRAPLAGAFPPRFLSDRLARSVWHDIARQVLAEDGTRRLTYVLTKKGRALPPFLGSCGIGN